MINLVIVAVSEGKALKDFTIPVISIEECLCAADAAFCGAIAFLEEQLKGEAENETGQEQDVFWESEHV